MPEKMKMMITANSFHCPCCGWSGLSCPAYYSIGEPPWGDHGQPPYESRYGMPSYEVCACCGFEFGNDDNPGTAEGIDFKTYLKDWIEHGCQWFDKQKKPEGWQLDAQLTMAWIQRDK